jgi:putative metalloprotease
MRKIIPICIAVATLSLGGCTSTGEFNTEAAVVAGMAVLQASTLSEDQVVQAASLASKEYDGQNKLAATNSTYMKRLAKIAQKFKGLDGLNPNFNVYMSEDINAFAMADGTVRVHSGLMDVMPDDQVAAVIGHELGHVKLKHSFNQMREQMLTNTAFQAVASVGGTVGELTAGQLGQLAHTAISSQFSRSDELEADTYAVKRLNRLGMDPAAMKRSIQTLEKIAGGGGGFLSSHPSNTQRIENIDESIAGLH